MGDGLGRGVGGGAGHGHLAGQRREVVLHRLEFGDRPLEGDTLVGVSHGKVEDGLQRAGHLHGAGSGTHQQQGLPVEPGRSVLDRLRPRRVEAHGIEGIAADAGAVGDAGLRRLDQGNRQPARLASCQHGQVLSTLGEGDRAQRPTQGAVAGQRELLAVARRPAAHGALGRDDAGPRQQPAGEQRLGQRHGRSVAARLPQHGGSVAQFGAGAAEGLGHPGEREARFLQRRPSRRLPGVVLGPIHGLRVGQVTQDPLGGVGDETSHSPLAHPLPSL